MIKSMKIGDERSYKRVITSNDVLNFGKLTGDMNQAHFDHEYCKTTIFKKPIVHGMLIGSLFSKLFGMEYPGKGTIYCSQSLKFLKPVYPDQELTIKISVKEIFVEKNKVIFLTEVFDNNNDLVVTGEALMMPRKDDKDE